MPPSSPSDRSPFHPDKAPDKTHLFVSIYDDRPHTSPPPTASQEAPHQSHHHHHHHASHHHRWTILVEQPPKPHHHWLSLHPHSHHHDTTDPAPTLFLINRDDHATSSWACHSRPLEPSDAESHLGKIHIGDCDAKRASTVQVQEVLRARLLPPEADRAGSSAEEEDDGGKRTSEHWIRAAVHALQDGGLVRKFDLDEFMTFARAYVVERSQVVGEGLKEDLAPPVTVEYVPVPVVGEEDGAFISAAPGGGSGTVVGVKDSKTTAKRGRRGFWISWPHAAANMSSSPARSREASPYGGLM